VGREKTGRPIDTPIGSGLAVTGQDFEQRKAVFPPSFIDELVLKGGDEYVKADDLKVLISAIVERLEPVLRNIETHLALGSDEELGKEESQ